MNNMGVTVMTKIADQIKVLEEKVNDIQRRIDLVLDQKDAEEHLIIRMARKVQGVEDKIDDNKACIVRNAELSGVGVTVMDRLVEKIEERSERLVKMALFMLVLLTMATVMLITALQIFQN